MDIISYLSTVYFGAGAIGSLKEILSQLGMSRPLLVSDHGIKAAGLLERPGLEILAGAPTFLDVPANPTESAVFAGMSHYLRHGCDGVVVVVVRSPLD